MTNLFFTYGTLMTGERNHHVIPKQAIEKTEKAYVQGKLYNHRSGSFPCLLPIFDATIIEGELITIKPEYLEEAIDSMDMLEGYISENNPRNFYNRELTEIQREDGTLTEAYVYFYNGSDVGSEITTNNWKTRRIEA